MKIKVNYIETSTVELSEDWEFACTHEFAEIEPPCCSGRDCGCYGLYGVYCYDCNNDDLTEHQVQQILDERVQSYDEYLEDRWDPDR